MRTDRPAILKSRVSDSVHPTDRPAARSAAKQILGRSTRPTDPLGPRPSRSEALFDQFSILWPFALLAGGRNDRPTDPTPTDSGQSDLPTDRPTQRPFPHAELTFNLAPPIQHSKALQLWELLRRPSGCPRCALALISSPEDTALTKLTSPAEIIQVQLQRHDLGKGVPGSLIPAPAHETSPVVCE